MRKNTQTAARQISTKHIVLVGLMGSGKTTVGRELGRIMKCSILDMDALIEEQIGKSIPDIFREDGEAHFRSLETAFLRYLIDDCPEAYGGCVISTGGGVIGSEENRMLLRQLGFVVWLDVDINTLVKRTARSNNRPLLNDASPRETLRKLLSLRAPLYNKVSHYRINTDRLEVAEVVGHVREAAALYFAD